MATTERQSTPPAVAIHGGYYGAYFGRNEETLQSAKIGPSYTTIDAGRFIANYSYRASKSCSYEIFRGPRCAKGRNDP